MAFAQVLDIVGSAGRFQVMHVLIVTLPMLFLAACNIFQNFGGATPSHRCRVPWIDGPNATLAQPGLQQRGALHDGAQRSSLSLLRAAVPLNPRGKDSACEVYTKPQWHLMRCADGNGTGGGHGCDGSGDGGGDGGARAGEDVQVEGCANGWKFDQSEFTSTIVTEWDLVCDRSGLKQMAQTVYMGGLLIGAVVFGDLGDRLGRGRVLSLSYLLTALASTATAFAPNLAIYTAGRCVVGLGVAGISLNAFSLGVEWIAMKDRTLYGTLSGVAYTTGQLVLVALAYYIRDWRHLQHSISAAFYVFFLCSWFTPESARWLVMHGHYERALHGLKRVAVINGRKREAVHLTVNYLRKELEEEDTGPRRFYTMFNLLTIPALRRRTLVMSLVWFSTSFSYYGFSLNIRGFAVNIFLMQVIYGAIDYPAKVVGLVVLSLLGRRATQAGSLAVASIASFCLLAIPAESITARTCLAVLGKGALSCSFNCAYLYTGEIFPTVIRQSGLGLCSTMARVGGMLAPLVIMVGESLPALPLSMYGGASLVAGSLVYFLPETLNRPLPETIEELSEAHARDREMPLMKKKKYDTNGANVEPQPS
ncbi:solute carrier family 22 member 6 [Lethenteron reissneri]|uniref:solute carrier family 22 member 6 n=1 Tax=Lethenteron reissneri TaxID=7753 RepID=UPI002AB7337B|nr:solute carrier family 22 member 6 [Lethenteron reissneri]